MIKIPLEPLTLRRRAASVGSELEQRYRNETCCDGRRHRHVLEDDAEVIGVDPVALRDTIRRVPDIESLDEPEVGGGPSRDTRIEDRRSPNPQDAAEAFEATGHLRDAVAHLPERLRTLMRRRYGLDGARRPASPRSAATWASLRSESTNCIGAPWNCFATTGISADSAPAVRPVRSRCPGSFAAPESRTGGMPPSPRHERVGGLERTSPRLLPGSAPTGALSRTPGGRSPG